MKITKELEQEYIKWLKKNNQITPLQDGYYSITTPFTNSNTDTINLYAKIQGNQIILNDFGFTLFNLRVIGINITKNVDTKWNILKTILVKFNIKLNKKNNLVIKVPIKQFPQAENRMIQGIIHIEDLDYLKKENN